MTRHFCLLTTGRAGSSQLMASLAALPGVVTPMAADGGVHYELLHPKARRAHLQQLLGGADPGGTELPTATALALVEAFQLFAVSQGASWSGFKSMPHQLHHAWQPVLAQPDLLRITLVRRDLAATAASFAIARLQHTWARRGGRPATRWRFLPEHRTYIRQVTGYLLNAQALLRALPGAIAVVYEDLVAPGWQHPDLDAAFGAAVRVARPRGATRLADQVENWQELAACVDAARQDHAARNAGLRVSLHLQHRPS